jgi:hypothetical protein
MQGVMTYPRTKMRTSRPASDLPRRDLSAWDFTPARTIPAGQLDPPPIANPGAGQRVGIMVASLTRVTAMTQITAWIVALTLTASPVTTSLCAAACGHQSALRAHCHESVIEPVAPAMSAEANCETSTIDVAYVKETVAAPHVAGVSPSTPPISRLTACARLQRSLAAPIATAWLAPPLVLRV